LFSRDSFKTSQAILAIIMAASGIASAAMPLHITTGDHVWSINPETLEFYGTIDGTTFTISRGREKRLTAIIQPSDGQTSRRWSLPDAGLSFDVSPTTDSEGLIVTINSSKEQSLTWPILPIPSDSKLIWPQGEGLIFEATNSFFQTEVFGREWEVGESLSLPLFGVESNASIFSFFTTNPHRNTIQFAKEQISTSDLSVDCHFSEIAPSMKVSYCFYMDKTENPLSPALRYREYLKDSGRFKTLEQKSQETSNVELLRGAAHVYLWDSGIFSNSDIPRNNWRPFCQKLIAESSSNWASIWLKENFTNEQWNAVIETAKSEWPYDYLTRLIAEGISATLTDEKSVDSLVMTGIELPVELHRSFAISDSRSVVQMRSDALRGAFADFFLPVEQWGNGASLKMLEAFSEAGLARLKLCTPDHKALKYRQWVAKDATRRGWLIGTYDSYHSVHSPDEKPDNTWSTAQMTEEIFNNDSAMKKDGNYYQGFRGVGRKTNSLEVRSFLEKRISSNMADVPYNYYFIDCDATGEIYDDYNPNHPSSKEMDAGERNRRLKWIAKTFDAVVGSEGGNAFASESIAVAEGVFGPFFGWDESVMKDQSSKFYRGRYYPPEAPDVFFKPVPLLDRFKKLFYDPAHKLPLYAAVFHDSVVATHHWNNGHFKYPEIQGTVELLEMLYLAPPLYHFNLQEFKKRRPEVERFYKLWSPLHAKYGFHAMTNFRYLTADLLVQQTEFGSDCVIMANFADEARTIEGKAIPAKSIVIRAPEIWSDEQTYTPQTLSN